MLFSVNLLSLICFRTQKSSRLLTADSFSRRLLRDAALDKNTVLNSFRSKFFPSGVVVVVLIWSSGSFFYVSVDTSGYCCFTTVLLVIRMSLFFFPLFIVVLCLKVTNFCLLSDPRTLVSIILLVLNDSSGFILFTVISFDYNVLNKLTVLAYCLA